MNNDIPSTNSKDSASQISSASDEYPVSPQVDASFSPLDIASRYNPLKFIRRFKDGLLAVWNNLHANQRIYLFALIMLAYFSYMNESVVSDNISVSGEMDEEYFWVGMIAIVGFSRELWGLFLRIWETMAGKSVVLVFYAIIANISLALAGQKVNQLTGVEPGSLIYTQGFVTMMLLPLWIFTFSLIAMVCILLLSQLWILFIGVLKLFRVHHAQLTINEHYPVWFLFARIILLPSVLYALAIGVDAYAKQLNYQPANSNMFSQIASEIIRETNSEDGDGVNVGIKLELEEEFSQMKKDIEEAAKVEKTPADGTPVGENAGTSEVQKDDSKYSYQSNEPTDMEKIITHFIYSFDSYGWSHCKKKPEEHVLVIDDNYILVVAPNNEKKGQFIFSTRLCDPSATDHKLYR